MKPRLAFVQEARLGKDTGVEPIGQTDIVPVHQWFFVRPVRTVDLGDEGQNDTGLFRKSLKCRKLLRKIGLVSALIEDLPMIDDSNGFAGRIGQMADDGVGAVPKKWHPATVATLGAIWKTWAWIYPAL